MSGFIEVCKFIVYHLQDGGRCAVFSVASFHGSFLNYVPNIRPTLWYLSFVL